MDRAAIDYNLRQLVEAKKDKTLNLGRASIRIPAQDLVRALEPVFLKREQTLPFDIQPREMPDLEVGIKRGFYSSVRSVAPVVAIIPALAYGLAGAPDLLTSPGAAFIPMFLYSAYELAYFTTDILSGGQAYLRAHRLYKKVFPFQGMREGEVNRAVLAKVEDRFAISRAHQFFLLANPKRANRLAATFLSNGYKEQALDPADFVQDNEPFNGYSSYLMTDVRP